MKDKEKVARPERLELPTLWFEARRSIQLSYGRADTRFTLKSLAQFLVRFQPRVSPHSHPWQLHCLTIVTLQLQLPVRRKFRSIWSNIDRNLEPDADYFHFAKSLFQFYIRTGI